MGPDHGFVHLAAVITFVALAAQAWAAEPFKEDPAACPLATLLGIAPALNGDAQPDGNHVADFVFLKGEVPRRIGIALKTHPRAKLQNVGFVWNSPSWGEYTGAFKVPVDGAVHCYFLGSGAGIPENVAPVSLRLSTAGVAFENVLISEKPSDAPQVTCPGKERFRGVQAAYAQAKAAPADAAKSDRFAEALAVLFGRYDCRRSFDTHPVPAFWLCGERGFPCGPTDVDEWLELLAKSRSAGARKVFASPEFRAALDGGWAESYLEASKAAARGK